MASVSVSPDSTYPLRGNSDNVFRHRGWRILTRKLPILKAGPIDEMTLRLGITPPEMIFGDNAVVVEHEQLEWGIHFNAFDALDRVDKTGKARLSVAYSKEWQRNRCVFSASPECRSLSNETDPERFLGSRFMKASKKSSSLSIGPTPPITRARSTTGPHR